MAMGSQKGRLHVEIHGQISFDEEPKTVKTVCGSSKKAGWGGTSKRYKQQIWRFFMVEWLISLYIPLAKSPKLGKSQVMTELIVLYVHLESGKSLYIYIGSYQVLEDPRF